MEWRKLHGGHSQARSNLDWACKSGEGRRIRCQPLRESGQFLQLVSSLSPGYRLKDHAGLPHERVAEERERRHKAELAALEAQMQAKLEVLTRVNEDISHLLDRASALLVHRRVRPTP